MILGIRSFPGRSSLAVVAALGFAAGVAAGATVTSGVAHQAGGGAAADPTPAHPPAAAFELRTGYPTHVLRVIDGDTFEARVRVWPGLDITTKVRLRGIDAPEMQARCDKEQIAAEAARKALDAMLSQGDVGLSAVSLDKYGGRVVALASARGTPDVSRALLAAGLARPYERGRRETWCGVSARR